MLIRVKGFPKVSDFTDDYTLIRRVTRRLAQDQVLLFFTAGMLINCAAKSPKDLFFVEYYQEEFDSLGEFVEVSELEYVASYQTVGKISDKIKELLKIAEKRP